jgi:hypothetical protein
MSAAIACPYCSRVNDLHGYTKGVADPSAGDVAICWRCGEISVFTDGPLGLAQRKPTSAELEEILADQQIRRALAARAESYYADQALALLRGDPR